MGMDYVVHRYPHKQTASRIELFFASIRDCVGDEAMPKQDGATQEVGWVLFAKRRHSLQNYLTDGWDNIHDE